MSMPATARYRLRTAPPGLDLVQDLLNTRAIRTYGPDLLARLDMAQAWADDALRQWAAARGVEAPQISLSEPDLEPLRATRSLFERLVDGEPVSPLPAGRVAASIGLSERDTFRLEPSGRGWRWLESALWCEAMVAQQEGTWKRLKRCRNPLCASAFYDGSKNNSGIWHDVRTCGNVANLRASRARRRAAKEVPPPER